ncbi:hypothetical protein FS749_010538 [Ceratobasidium sp. UAMH 11750]|nr:hypothetical protein FS749_010538 [Ceratobasidium sp. UAMH 11750]
MARKESRVRHLSDGVCWQRPVQPDARGQLERQPATPLTGGAAGAIGPAPGQPCPPPSLDPTRVNSDGVRKLPALAISAPNGDPGSPPFRAPPPVQLDERSGRGSNNQLVSMDMDRAAPAPSSLLLVHPSHGRAPTRRNCRLPLACLALLGRCLPRPIAAPAVPRRAGHLPTRTLRAPAKTILHPQGYNGYPGGDAAWEREKAREGRGCETDRDSQNSR